MIGKEVRQFSGPADKGVRWWFTQLDRGIKRRKKEEKVWDRNEKFANGKQWDEDFGGGDQVTVNKIRTYINQHRSSVAFRMPRVKMIPRTPAGYATVQVPVLGEDGTPQLDQMGQVVTRGVIPAKARERLFNDIISQPLFGLSETIDRVDMAALLGYGAACVGYRPEFETAPQTDGEQKIPILPDGQLDFSNYVTSPITGMPVEDDNGRLVRKASVPVWEDWFIDWVPYRNIIIDPDGENDFMQHRWVAIEQVRYLDDVKADPLFSGTKDLQGTGDYDDDETMERYESWLEGEDKEDKAKVIRLFHIYDFVKDRYLVLADGHGKALRDEVTPLGITHSPLEFLRYQEVLGEFYPHSKATDQVPINEWYNNSRRLEYVGAKGSLRKVIVDQNTFDAENLGKLTSDVDMEVVTRQSALNPYSKGSLEVFTPPPVNPSVYNASAAASADFDEMSGSPEARGQASADTATQSNNLQAGENARNSYERMQMKNFLVKLFKKLNDSIDANMTVERAVQIEDVDGYAFTALVDQDMIAGDFDIEIDVHEMAPSDNAQMAANRIQLLQMAGSYPHQFADPVRARGWCELFNIHDELFIASVVEGAQMQIQMAMIEAQPPMPEAPPPGDEAQAISQSAAGQQVPAMQGAR